MAVNTHDHERSLDPSHSPYALSMVARPRGLVLVFGVAWPTGMGTALIRSSCQCFLCAAADKATPRFKSFELGGVSKAFQVVVNAHFRQSVYHCHGHEPGHRVLPQECCKKLEPADALRLLVTRRISRSFRSPVFDSNTVRSIRRR